MRTQTTAIIRDRGQLTIPDEIREQRGWVNPGSVVNIETPKSDEIVIRPYTHSQKDVDREKLWNLIKRSRAIKGKGKMSASEFIAKDRETHF